MCMYAHTWTRLWIAGHMHAILSRARLSTVLRRRVVATSDHSLMTSSTCQRTMACVPPLTPVSMNWTWFFWKGQKVSALLGGLHYRTYPIIFICAISKATLSTQSWSSRMHTNIINAWCKEMLWQNDNITILFARMLQKCKMHTKGVFYELMNVYYTHTCIHICTRMHKWRGAYMYNHEMRIEAECTACTWHISQNSHVCCVYMKHILPSSCGSCINVYRLPCTGGMTLHTYTIFNDVQNQF